MHHRRFLAVLIALTLALQLALAGRGATCVTPSGDDERMAMTQGEPDMTGMDMSGGTPEPSAATNCQPFASCAAGIMVADASAGAANPDISSAPRVADFPALVSRTIAPELPPPRL